MASSSSLLLLSVIRMWMASSFMCLISRNSGKIYSPWVQGRSQAKTSKRILFPGRYTFQTTVKSGSPKRKALLDNWQHPYWAMCSAKGPDPSLCDLFAMSSTDSIKEMETGRDWSFIKVINACSPNHWKPFIFTFSTPYLIQLRPELIIQGVNKETYCFPETQKES